MQVAEPSRITVDQSMWPLVVCVFQGAPQDEDWKAMFLAYEGMYARGERFHIVNECSRVQAIPSPAQRKVIAEAAEKHGPMSRKWVLGGATVVPNALVRGVITAITWVAPPAYKLTLHPNVAEAFDEAFRTFASHGIAVPERARKHRAALGTTTA